MGFDIYGQHAKNEDGEYFRNNVWWWRPLWELIVEVNKDVLTVAEAKAGQYNDGKLISKAKAKKIDGDPQTSLVQSETFFLSRALNPSGERDASLFLPTVVLPDGLNGANLDNYQVVMLANLAALPDGFVTRLQNFLRQGGGLLIFTCDKFQPTATTRNLARRCRRNCATRKPARSPAARKST